MRAGVCLVVLEVPSCQTPLPRSRKASWESSRPSCNISKNGGVSLAVLELWELLSGHMIACLRAVARMKIDDCIWKTSSVEQIFVVRHQGSVNGGKTGVFESESSVFLFK